MSAKRQRSDTHCANGHLLDARNLYYSPYTGLLKCRACSREYQARWYAKHGARRGQYKPRTEAGQLALAKLMEEQNG